MSETMIVNETKNNVENNVKAGMYTSQLVRLLMELIAGPLFVGLGTGLLFLDKADLFFPIFLFVFAGLLELFLLFGFKPLVRKLTKRALLGKETLNVYTFSDETYEVRSTDAEGTESVTTGAYHALYRVIEYADLWLIYYNKTSIFMVSKSGMKKGTAEDLSVFLGVKMGNGYLTRCRKK